MQKRIRSVVIAEFWPKSHSWPKPPGMFEERAKPVRTIGPKKVRRKPAIKSVTEAVIGLDGLFQHPLNVARVKAGLPPKEFKLDQSHLLDKARQQLEKPETRHSVRKGVHKNLSRK